jgi:peptide chain release factor 3
MIARWVSCEDQKRLGDFERNNAGYLAHDAEGHLTFLASSEWRLKNCMEKWPEIAFLKTREHN